MEVSYQSSLGEWIGAKSWTHFTTITSPFPLSITSAGKLAQRTLDKWKSITSSDAEMVYCIERNTDGGSHHIHALVNFHSVIPDHLFSSLIDMKGHVDLQRYDHTLRGAEYIVKSVNERADNWDFIS